MRKCFFIFFVFIILQSCTQNRVIEVKSPCVGADGSPCGPKIPINTWLNNGSA